MIELYNPNRYLEPNIIEPCFIDGKTLSINKQLCGNGLSTAFFKIKPSHGKVNILIAPNKAFVQDKELKYKENPSQYAHNRLKFFYKETKEYDFNNADVLVFVADSFWYRRESLSSIACRVEKVLIDEIHSTEQQSFDFRYILQDFVKKVETVFNYPFTAIATATATPMLFSKSDVTIYNSHVEEQTLYTSKDRSEAVKRINKDKKNKENVVVFGNCANTIYNLRDYKNVIKANFIIGTSLMQKVVRLATVVNDDKSNVIIASSKGFEGFDIEKENVKVYFFENRSREHESFYISNLYQAISRPRKGAKYIEYCRQERTKNRKDIFKDIDKDIKAFVSPDFKYKGKIQSIENKQKRIFKDYHSYVIFEYDKDGIYTVKPNQIAINLYKETRIYDKTFPAQEFDEFIKDRKLIFKDISDVSESLKNKVKRSQKIKNLYSNRELIKKEGLFDDNFTIDVVNLHSYSITDIDKYRKLYLNHLDDYLMCKNYDGEYVNTERQQIALNILNNKKKFKALVKDVTKAYEKRSREKYEIKEGDIKRKEFRVKAASIVGAFIIMYCNKRIKVPSKWVAHRNYNLLTEIGIDAQKLIADAFNVSILEIDIVSCYPRIIYALNNKRLPDNFYGENKKNKKTVNMFLNDFFYRSNDKTEKKHQRVNAIRKFQRLGFDDDVIKYLIDNYFECEFRGDLFSRASFQERKIISDIKRVCDLNNDGVIRRHDSIIVFNNKADLSFINEYEYLGTKGWFNVKPIPVYELIRLNNLDEKTVNF